MNIDDLTLGEIKKLQGMFSNTSSDHPFEIGKNYLIRTVTMIISGTLKWVGEKEIQMDNAAWIADTGRFHDALKDQSKFNEVEPFPNPVIIGRGSIIDATEIKDVPMVQK